MIGQKWYYVVPIGTEYQIESATIEGETPRKWILRQDDTGEWARKRQPLGETSSDWTIPKKGENQREGRGGLGGTSTRIFLASKELARIEVQRRMDERWAASVSYRIARKVQYCRDAGILRKVAEIIGWREDQT